MKHFPSFIKNSANRVPSSQQHTEDIEGYYFTANNGSQAVLWECHADRESEQHRHEFDEYILCVAGEYIACFEDREVALAPGEELLISAGTLQWGRCKAGTRTIHVFAAQRIHNPLEISD